MLQNSEKPSNIAKMFIVNKICFTLDPLFKNKFKILLTLHLLKATTKNSNPPCWIFSKTIVNCRPWIACGCSEQKSSIMCVYIWKMSPRICISRNGSSLQKSLHLHIRRTVILRELRTYYKVHISDGFGYSKKLSLT